MCKQYAEFEVRILLLPITNVTDHMHLVLQFSNALGVGTGEVPFTLLSSYEAVCPPIVSSHHLVKFVLSSYTVDRSNTSLAFIKYFNCCVHKAQTEPYSEPSEPTLHHHTIVAEIQFNIILTLHMRLGLPSKLSPCEFRSYFVSISYLFVHATYVTSLILYDLIARTKYSEGMWTRTHTHAYARPHAHVHDHMPVHTKSSMAAKQSVQLMLAEKSRAINRTCGCDVQSRYAA